MEAIMYYIHTYRILGTTELVSDVYEDYDGHFTFTHMNEKRVGSVTARRLPSELDSLRPMSPERSQAVRSWQEGCRLEANQVLVSNPQTETGWVTV